MPSSESTQIEQSFTKTFASLHSIFEFLNRFVTENRLDPSVAFSIKFSVEEVFTNMVKYNPNGKNVSIKLNREGTRVSVELTDLEEKPFDITVAHDPNVNLPLEKRRPGGLGIFLIKKMMDQVEYRHNGTQSNITLVKYLER